MAHSAFGSDAWPGRRRTRLLAMLKVLCDAAGRLRPIGTFIGGPANRPAV
jgi:hypothetical protein